LWQHLFNIHIAIGWQQAQQRGEIGITAHLRPRSLNDQPTNQPTGGCRLLYNDDDANRNKPVIWRKAKRSNVFQTVCGIGRQRAARDPIGAST
jgi:hypothetical protein